jgi:hypothetical protein
LRYAATVVLTREHGVGRIYTRDTGFHRFAHTEPIDPTRSGSLGGVHSGRGRQTEPPDGLLDQPASE